ncbi:MAG TPA: phosphoribosylformylglycinamidine synthase [Feifaniaceae bacterium]|nr:phosphoribosylformylglycinamidine synthase [Feifaniaceae bacterium]
MVFRVYVEKRRAFAAEAEALLTDIRSFLRIEGLERIRVFNRYDVEGISEDLFLCCKTTVFSEPQTDVCLNGLPEALLSGCAAFAVEYLPGQFDQRADSAAQCIQLVSMGERPQVRTAKVYLLYGDITEAELAAVKKHVINPVESREASFNQPDTLMASTSEPEAPPVLHGFCMIDGGETGRFIKEYGLAMDADDLRFCQGYFKEEQRDPTLTELRAIDTYWSDHCRHTTFLTQLSGVTFAHADAQKAYERYLKLRETLQIQKPVTLMDIATIAQKALKAQGKLGDLDESEEINACTVKIKAEVDGIEEDWLLLFKNETHNHPTEIEPFGGAATCIGGAIRDPLSGRAYVYQAMRITGAADPLAPVEETLPGKLPQRKLVTTAAAGYSSYGNQIGLPTGIVEELYHPGYAAKHMELGAVIGAAPAKNVRRETPAPGDVILLLGGRTGRDGCGGATGSSKAHNARSLELCGAEVQKGNAPEERKLQRLFRNPEAARLIKRCNDFGAGGVSVAVGELADGLTITLDAVPEKYNGLSATELAISESQERMAVVLAPDDAEAFMRLAAEENLEATEIAVVTKEKRLVMRHRGRTVVDISRAFLNSNGAPKMANAHVLPAKTIKSFPWEQGSVQKRLSALVSDLNFCSRQGLAERFDSTIGAGTVLMPFGGRRQNTPAQAMAALLPVLHGGTRTCSVMAYGCDPYVSEADPYRGAYLAVLHSLAKLAAAGASTEDAYLTLQEYFPRLGNDENRWGLPLAALLGAADAQLDYGCAAIGGKDSMSGSFESLDVPPTLVSFAVAAADAAKLSSPELKHTGARVVLLAPEYKENGLPEAESVKDVFGQVHSLIQSGRASAVYALGRGGVAEAVFKMGLGNRIGVRFEKNIVPDTLLSPRFGAFVAELKENVAAGTLLGMTQEAYEWTLDGEQVALDEIERIYESRLAPVYPMRPKHTNKGSVPAYSRPGTPKKYGGASVAKPRVLIPVFPGTNCEYDTGAAFLRAGAKPELFLIKNLTPRQAEESVRAFADALSNSQILFLPGGFSGGDEPDGSGKFITAFLRNPRIREEISRLLETRDGLIGGVCNGFQALIKLGLVPFGEIRDMDEFCPTLTYNEIGRHQSRIVHTRVAANGSPWLMHTRVGEVYSAPASHGEGRFLCPRPLFDKLSENGQLVTQYADETGAPTMDIAYNPNGSMGAVEGVVSPNGRVLGKMAHSERTGPHLYKNVPGNYDMPLFRGAADYFRF